MNRLLPLALLFCAHLAFGQQPSGRYTITGYLTHLQGRTVYLVSESSLFPALSGNKAAVLDSAQSTDGHFTLQGVLNEPHQYALLVSGVKSAKHFLLSQAPLTIIGSADSIGKASVEGSLEVRHQQILANQLKPIREQSRQLTLRKNQAVQQHDTSAESKAIQDQRFLSEQIQATTIAFIERYPGSLASLFELNLLVHDLPKEQARALWNQLTYPLQQHSIGQSIHQKLFPGPEQPGQLAPSLILADSQDKPVSLQAYQGTLTLVDFWVSGCEPCRQEHTRLRTLYEQYKEKGLQIVSISIDANPLLWKKALQKSQLPWPQLTDRVGNKNVIGSQYGTNQLPINMLIDQEGNVIRKGLHGPELEKQVAAAFSTK